MRTKVESASLQDLLSLVEVYVDLSVIDGWTDAQKSEAQKWAWKTSLRASDNIVRVPPKPAFLG